MQYLVEYFIGTDDNQSNINIRNEIKTVWDEYCVKCAYNYMVISSSDVSRKNA